MSRVVSSTAVFPAMMPLDSATTVWARSKTAMVMSKVLEMRVTATKVLNTQRKNVQVSKFARLLWSMTIWISS